MIQYPLGAAGTLTRVLEAGRGDRTMLLVHGVGARADRWRLNLDALAEAGYHAYAIDLPGHGLAEKGRPLRPFRAQLCDLRPGRARRGRSR